MLSKKESLSPSGRGQNVLLETGRKNILQRFTGQLNDPLIFILFVAAAISLLLREYADASIILAVILLNALVGIIQEGRAQKALDALKVMTSPHAIILEKGIPKEILAKDLTCGDLVLLDAGRRVPADLLLKEAQNLKIEEAALTGESLPVDKDTFKHNEAFMSTNVTYGRGMGIVKAIGMDTQIGRIATLINEAPSEDTPLQKRLGDLGKLLSIISLVLCGLLFGIALLQHRDIGEMLITAISLAVAAVPEGLPAIVTMVLALCVSRMADVNTIVKKLPSVETLGCVSIICSDKTGTLTQNKMSVTECYTDQHFISPSSLSLTGNKHFLQGFLLCNDAVLPSNTADSAGGIGDPTELALLSMGQKLSVHKEQLEKIMPRMGELPFDSARKMMTTLHRENYSYVSYTKGSPDEVINRCTHILSNGHIAPLSSKHKADIYDAIRLLSEKALRILALGMAEHSSSPTESNLTFLGLVGMKDPLRPEAKTAVEDFKTAGVKTVMITGDRADTAFAIAKELGIAGNISQCISGASLDSMDERTLAERLSNTTVFAGVSPEHKTMIVSVLKKRGHIVAMTGDGVNDAPSLKTADVGIAMGITGTDVAKNAADLILTDDNFSTIYKAIEQGRSIYANIKKSVLFLLSSNFGEIITMLAAIVIGFPAPLKPGHILWINLITDSLPALALGIDSGDSSHFMKKAPRPKEENLFAEGGLSCTLVYGVLIAGISLGAYLLLPLELLLTHDISISITNLQTLLGNADIQTRCQTYAFTVLGMSQLFHAIGMRDVECSIFRMKHFSNKLMIVAFIVGLSLQLLVTTVPYFTTAFDTYLLTWKDYGLLLAISAMPLVVHELLLRRKR